MAKTIDNAEQYRLLLEPFDDSEAADEALDKFFDEFYQLRVKHGLPDVTVIVSGSIKNSGPFLWSAHAGSQNEVEVMAAWHLGHTQSERQDRVRRALESGGALLSGKKVK